MLQWSPGDVAGDAARGSRRSRTRATCFNGAPVTSPGMGWGPRPRRCTGTLLQWSPGDVAGDGAYVDADNTVVLGLLQWSPGDVAGDAESPSPSSRGSTLASMEPR